ncbi:MAG: hypothetical protein IJ220_02785 [Clostridia bacterium]|nr:hypothetical protein [Clostridia bacterium]
MNPKKLMKIILVCAILLFILIVISTIINSGNQKKSDENNQSETTHSENEYNYNTTIDLDKEDTQFEYDPGLGTDYPNFGTISDYYENADVYFDEDKLYIQTYDGHDVISSQWNNEGYAIYINEPQFGELEKFILSSNSITASYADVKMRDTISYINELSGLGFNEVLKNDKNNSSDYYIYSAKKGDITVTLNYEKGKLIIMVF